MLLTKDEDDILEWNLKHHYSIGFRNFCIIDNRSGDATAETVQRFRVQHSDAFVFYCYDSIAKHYQAAKTKVFQELIVAYMAIEGITLQWLFFLDTDEFLCCASPEQQDRLRVSMDDPTIDVIVFHWVLMTGRVAYTTTPIGIHPFKAFPVMRLLMPPATKVALRVGRHAYPNEGNHWMLAYDGSLEGIRLIAADGWFMFHFPVRSFGQMTTKVVNGGAAFRNTEGLDDHGLHWKERYERYLHEGADTIREMVEAEIAVGLSEGILLNSDDDAPE